ncbi:hypothetical protein AA313_de0206067 [Arthrobotrys entomopaga]|nr:hypothetical protein AA313_de0206067 [Arthrobotrys entomopaga]
MWCVGMEKCVGHVVVVFGNAGGKQSRANPTGEEEEEVSQQKKNGSQNKLGGCRVRPCKVGRLVVRWRMHVNGCGTTLSFILFLFARDNRESAYYYYYCLWAT